MNQLAVRPNPNKVEAVQWATEQNLQRYLQAHPPLVTTALQRFVTQLPTRRHLSI